MADPSNPQTADRLKRGKSLGGRPRILTNPQETQRLIDEFFSECQASDTQNPTMTGLALHLGFDCRKSLHDAEDREDEFSPVIKRAILRVENYHENRIGDPRGNPAGSIFWLKNRGWRDKQEHEHTGDLKIEIVQH